jgi:hypothetical protein
MKLEKVNQWLLLVSHLGILGGLVLVGLQVRQDVEIARVQLFSDITSSRMDMLGSVLGENPAPVVMKSLVAPDALTDAELYLMDAFLVRGLNEVRRAQVLKRVDLDVGISAPENTLAFYFGNAFAKRWWAGFVRKHEPDDVLREIDALVRATDPGFTLGVIRSMEAPGGEAGQ